MANVKVVGFRGPAGVGKTTLAHAVMHKGYDKAELEIDVESFSRPLKSMASSMGFSKDTDPEAYRAFCVIVGAHICRLRNPDFFLAHAQTWLNMAIHLGHDAIIFDDVRYPNEEKWILDNGGIVYSLHRSDFTPGQEASPPFLKKVIDSIVGDYLPHQEGLRYSWDDTDAERYNRHGEPAVLLDIGNRKKAIATVMDYIQDA